MSAKQETVCTKCGSHSWISFDGDLQPRCFNCNQPFMSQGKEPGSASDLPSDSLSVPVPSPRSFELYRSSGDVAPVVVGAHTAEITESGAVVFRRKDGTVVAAFADWQYFAQAEEPLYVFDPSKPQGVNFP
jgi:hypothetical protein